MTDEFKIEGTRTGRVLAECICVAGMYCHFCDGQLTDTEDFTDSEAWCDWVRTVGGLSFHILAHYDCAEGQIGVTRG